MNDTVGGSANCLAPGVQVGEYRLLDVIGEGGFGIVYRARDISLDRIVAIKEYMPATLAGRKSSNAIHVRSQHRGAFDAGLRSFINEARLLAKFSHPALVHVYRFFELNGTAYMVMRHYEGQTLREFLNTQQERVNQRMLAAIIGPVLDVVEMLHAADCYHRDIAPDNLFLQNSGMPVLLDFGAARRIIGDMTQALTMVLKPGFAPIEQYVDDGAMPQGAWTDIYQIGAMLYLAITGKPPATSVARMINDPVAVLLPATYPGYSAQFLQGVGHALAVKPQDRPQTISALRELLGITTFTMPMSAPWQNTPPSAAAHSPALQTLQPQAASDMKTPQASTHNDAAVAENFAGPNTNLAAWDLLSQTPSASTPPQSKGPAEYAVTATLGAIPGLQELAPKGDTPATETLVVKPDSTTILATAPPYPEAPPVPPLSSADAAATRSAPPLKKRPEAPHHDAVAQAGRRQAASRPAAIRWTAIVVALAAATALAAWWGTHGDPASKSGAEVAFDQDRQHWKEAQTQGTASALEAYLSAHPTGKHRSEAMTLLDRIEVQEPALTAPAAPAAAEAVTAVERPAQAAAAIPPLSPTAVAAASTAPKTETPPASAMASAEPTPTTKAPPKPVGDVGRVVLRISPWGRISVNGSSMGTTPPLTHVELPEGSHRIEVNNPAAAPVVKTVQVKKGEPVVISHQFE
jgi:serine/threonine protein kinase